MRRWSRTALLAAVVGLHIAALLTLRFQQQQRRQDEDTSVFRMVDVQELIPEPPPPEPETELPPPEPLQQLEGPAEDVEVVDELPQEQATDRRPPATIEYRPQHLISVAPGIPTDAVLANIEYPELANRQGVEGVVILELFIDAQGVIRRIEVLRDPGFGLGAAAVAAFDGITATPAEANGEVVPVRFRYPVRFQLR